MYKLLSRFAWMISFIFGLSLSFAVDRDGPFDEEGLVYFIIGLLCFKFFLLSKKFINERISFFVDSLRDEFSFKENNSFVQVPETKKVKEEAIDDLGIEKNEIEQEDNLDLINNNEKDELLDEYELERQQILAKNVIKEEKVEKIIKEEKIEEVPYEPSNVELFLESLGKGIKDFFSTNLIAKLGAILIFLAVVYFLKGAVVSLWNLIGDIGRIIVGFIVGFTAFGFGVRLHGKGIKNEGLILMGVGILINYVVILLGRYIVGGDGYLTEGTTFIFLILNTIFGVMTSLVYKSKVLLVFSFIFGYLNPFIIGAESDGTPYTLVGYSLILSFGALFLSFKEKDLKLLFISFIFGNILFLVAPCNDSIGWVVKILSTTILSLSVIFTSLNFKNGAISLLPKLFLGSYVFVILHLLNSYGFLGELISFITYNIIILGLFVGSIYLFKTGIDKKNSESSGFAVLFFVPLIIFGLLLISGSLIYKPFILVSVLITYLIGFVVINNFLPKIFSYILFCSFIIFILIFDISFAYIGSEITKPEFLTLLFTSFIFLFSSYYFSSKEGLGKLYTIGTIGGVLTLLPIITTTGEFVTLSLIAIGTFAIANLLIPFLNKNLIEDKSNFYSLIIGTLVSVIFLAFEIFNFGTVFFLSENGTTGYVTLGFLYLGLAIIYCIEAFLIVQKIGIENIKNDGERGKNVFYTYAGISISLFSFAIAFVFSKYPEVITITWLFESTILYYFYNKTKETKIFIAGTILFLIGLTKFGILTQVVQEKDFMFLISFAIIFASFILNLKFIDFKNLEKESSNYNIVHYILHILAMGIMGILLLIIIPSTGKGWSMLGISTFLLVLGYFYILFNSSFLRYVFIFVTGGFGLIHIGNIDPIFNKLGRVDETYLKVLQYFVTLIVIGIAFLWNMLSKSKSQKVFINIVVGIYAFIISNVYVYDILEKLLGTFSITIYWGFIASVLLIYGIQKNILKFRTLGLYFLTLTSVKVFLYDVWEIGDTNGRVFAFGVLGVVFIVISTLYTKRYGDNLIGEFRLNNIFGDGNKEKKEIKTNKIKEDDDIEDENKEEENFDALYDNTEKKEADNFLVNKKIKDIDGSEYRGVTFKFSNGKKVEIRAKNLIKISMFIVNSLGKSNFASDELIGVFNNSIKNYKSELSKRDYDKIIKILGEFVKTGGEVVLNKKS